MSATIHPNRYKFLKAPTIEQIDEVIKKAGVSQSQFERFYGLRPLSIAQARCGFRELPAKHWHLFLEEVSNRMHQPIHRVAKIDKQKTKPRRKKATKKLSHLVV